MPSWMKGLEKMLLPYLRGQVDDVILFVQFAILEKGVPKSATAFKALGRTAFVWVLEHGTPTADDVTTALG